MQNTHIFSKILYVMQNRHIFSKIMLLTILY